MEDILSQLAPSPINEMRGVGGQSLLYDAVMAHSADTTFLLLKFGCNRLGI